MKLRRLYGIKWYKELYLGASIKGTSKWFKYKLVYHKRVFGYYLIMLPSNSDNLLDIVKSEMLSQAYYEQRPLHVIGIAGTKDEAFELVGHIIHETYVNTGHFNIQNYLGYR